MSSIEVEVKGFIQKDEFKRIEEFLKKNSKQKYSSTKEATFFVIPDTSLTVTKNLIKKTAKISYSSQNKNDELEIEFSIPYEESANAIKIFKNLGFNKTLNTKQDIWVYDYNGIKLKLKYGENWGYSFEMIVIVKNDDEIPDGMNKIDEFCRELNISYQSEKEISKYLENITSNLEN